MRRILPLVLLLWFCAAAQAAILHVPQEYPAIQAAMDSSADGDTVWVAPGTYHEHVRGPLHSVALVSNYLASRDTADIVNTVLDGDLSGTILRVRATGLDSLYLDGLTLTRGLGSQSPELCEGSAIHLELNANVVIMNCAFVGNAGHANWGQATVLKNVTDPFAYSVSRVRMENILLVDNGMNANFNQYAKCIDVYTNGDILVRRVRARATVPGYTGFLSMGGFESDMQAEDIVVEGIDGFRLYLCSGGKVSLRDIRMAHCRQSTMEGLGHSLTATRLTFEDLLLPGLPASRIALSGDSCAFIDSVTVTRCQIRGATWDWFQYSMLALICYNGTNEFESRVRHLVFTDNVGGDTTAIPGKMTQTRMVATYGLSLEDAVFLRNTMHFWPDPDDINTVFGDAVTGALLGYSTGMGLSNAQLTRCRFEDNLLLDHDVYMENPWDPISPNEGRSLSVSSSYSGSHPNTRSLEISDLLFRNNRQPNHVPERQNESDSIGSDFIININNGDMEELNVHDIYMENIDDGGLCCASIADNNRFENLVARNIGRIGMEVFCADVPGEHYLRNVWADSIVERDNYLSYPYTWCAQNAVAWSGEVVASNITITNSRMTNLVWATSGMRNCVEAGNQYQYLNTPRVDLYYHPRSYFNYASDVLPGASNMIGSDPLFDAEMGAPFLSPDSPCVDAGDPASAFLDPEDPARPGFALWPALGTRRNDIGYTGGPALALPDTDWVSVEQPYEPRQLPKDFRLGAAYPNPFNPLTRIPFTLTRPELVKLSVHNLLGQEVAVLVNGLKMAGRQEVVWDAAGRASGRYLVTLEVDGRRETRAVTLLR